MGIFKEDFSFFTSTSHYLSGQQINCFLNMRVPDSASSEFTFWQWLLSARALTHHSVDVSDALKCVVQSAIGQLG